MRRRGKAVAITAVVLGLGVLVGAGMAAKDRIVEEWWIHKLKTGSEEEKKAAAERLGRLKATRAIPYLIELMAKVEAEQGADFRWAVGSISGRELTAGEREQGISMQWKLHVQALWDKNWPGHALVRIGPQVVRPLVEELARGVQRDIGSVPPPPRVWAEEVLLRVSRVSVAALRELTRDESTELRQVADQFLAKIQRECSDAGEAR
jgi:hypothetical protein